MTAQDRNDAQGTLEWIRKEVREIADKIVKGEMDPLDGAFSMKWLVPLAEGLQKVLDGNPEPKA